MDRVPSTNLLSTGTNTKCQVRAESKEFQVLIVEYTPSTSMYSSTSMSTPTLPKIVVWKTPGGGGGGAVACSPSPPPPPNLVRLDGLGNVFPGIPFEDNQYHLTQWSTLWLGSMGNVCYIEITSSSNWLNAQANSLLHSDCMMCFWSLLVCLVYIHVHATGFNPTHQIFDFLFSVWCRSCRCLKNSRGKN